MSLLASHIIFQIYTTYVHENSAETLGPKYSIVIYLKLQKYDHSYANIILWLKDEYFC